jgi:probable addiction module antidote protein
MKLVKDHGKALVVELRADPELAREYVRAALEESDQPAVLLLALRRIAEAYGMSDVAARAGMKRESLYRALSPRGNPTLKTLCAILDAVGLRISFEQGHVRQ